MLDNAGGREAIARIAHKVKATWSLYAVEHPDLPERLGDALRQGDAGRVTALAESLVQALRTVSSELESWVEYYNRYKT